MMSFDIVNVSTLEATKEATKEAKPTRSVSGYHLFCSHMRVHGIKGVCQKRWRTMGDAEREMWNTKASVMNDAIKCGEPIPLYVLPHKSQNMTEAQIVVNEGNVWRVMSWWRKNEKNAPVVLNKLPKGVCAISKPRRTRNATRV